MLFKEIDARHYAALRIIFGTLAFLTLLGLIGESTFYYADDGWFPIKLAVDITNKKEWTLLHTITSPVGVKLFFLAAMAASISMAVGFYSRLASWVTFICIVSLHSRNWLNTYGGDAVLRLMLFYLGLSPSGLAWSADSLIKRFRAGALRLEKGEAPPRFGRSAPAVPAPVWPLRLMQIQVCLIYFTSGLAKLHGVDWLNGSALGLALLNPIFAKYNFSWIQTSSIAAFFIRVSTWMTLIWEISFPLLVVAHRWTRWLAIAIGIAVHGGIILFMQIHWFGYLMIGTYVSLLPSGAFRWLEVSGKRWARQTFLRKRIRVIYDGECSFCCQAVLLIGLLDWFGRLELIPSEAEESWRRHAPNLKRRDLDLALYAVPNGEKPVAGMDAFCEIGRVVPALAPLRWLAYLPGVRKLGRRLYAWISEQRYCVA